MRPIVFRSASCHDAGTTKSGNKGNTYPEAVNSPAACCTASTNLWSTLAALASVSSGTNEVRAASSGQAATAVGGAGDEGVPAVAEGKIIDDLWAHPWISSMCVAAAVPTCADAGGTDDDEAVEEGCGSDWVKSAILPKKSPGRRPRACQTLHHCSLTSDYFLETEGLLGWLPKYRHTFSRFAYSTGPG